MRLVLTTGYYLLIPDCIAQTAQKTSGRKAVFLTKMKVMCEEYKLDATQSLEEVTRYLSVHFKSHHRSLAKGSVNIPSRSELDKDIELLATPENDDIIEDAAKAFGKRHVSTQRSVRQGLTLGGSSVGCKSVKLLASMTEMFRVAI